MILVFKTNIDSLEKVEKLKPHLDSLMPEARWNVDLKDCDNVLRIEIENPFDIIEKLVFELNELGFECSELV